MYDENNSVYGIHKVWRQLQPEGIRVAMCTIARLMKDMGWLAYAGVKRSEPQSAVSLKPHNAEVIHRQSWKNRQEVELATLV